MPAPPDAPPPPPTRNAKDVLAFMYTDTKDEIVPSAFTKVELYSPPPEAKRVNGEISYKDAIREALAEEMLRDSRVVLYGEDVADYGGAFKVTKGLLEAFGRQRVFNTPISEACICGTACGAAMRGLRPVVELMYFDFALMSSDQISNQAAKWHYMSGAQTEVPLVIRASAGSGKGYGGQHSQTLELLFCHMPGLYVIYPSTPADAKGLLKSAIRDNNPVLFVESQSLYGMKGPIPEGDHLAPLGVADVKREGGDITFVSWGPTVHDCLKAAEWLKAERKVDAEVVDLRSLIPLDIETVVRSGAEDRALHRRQRRRSHRQLHRRDRFDGATTRFRLSRRARPARRRQERHFAPIARAGTGIPAQRRRLGRGRLLHPVGRAMVTPIVMPKFGQMTEESTIVEWLKKEGEKVSKGETLFSVETDKSVMEVESFKDGTLLKIVVGVGASVPVQSVVGYLGEIGEAIPATPVPERRAPAKAPPVPATAAPSWRSGAPAATVAASAGPAAPAVPAPAAATAPALFRISPRAAALARECVIDPHAIVGSGPEGRIVERDVKAYLDANGLLRAFA